MAIQDKLYFWRGFFARKEYLRNGGETKSMQGKYKQNVYWNNGFGFQRMNEDYFGKGTLKPIKWKKIKVNRHYF